MYWEDLHAMRVSVMACATPITGASLAIWAFEQDERISARYWCGRTTIISAATAPCRRPRKGKF